MKKRILFFAAVAMSLGSFAQQTGHEGHDHSQPVATTPALPKGEDVLQVNKMVHDFGQIPQGKPVFYNFEIVNTGKEAVKIENVQASCGCTTPEWSREAVGAGQKTIIKVGYNAAAEGFFDKPITITYNGISKQIKITGTVWKSPAGAAPANAAVQFLKKQDL